MNTIEKIREKYLKNISDSAKRLREIEAEIEEEIKLLPEYMQIEAKKEVEKLKNSL